MNPAACNLPYLFYFGGAYFLQKQNQEAAYAPVHGVG